MQARARNPYGGRLMKPAPSRSLQPAVGAALALCALLAGLEPQRPALARPEPQRPAGRASVRVLAPASSVRTLADALVRAQGAYQLHAPQRLLDAADLADQAVALRWTLQPLRSSAHPRAAALRTPTSKPTQVGQLTGRVSALTAASAPGSASTPGSTSRPGVALPEQQAQLLPLDPAWWRRDASMWLVEGDGRARRHAHKPAVRRVGATAVRWVSASLAPWEAHRYPWSYPRGGAVEVALVSTPGTEATLEVCDAQGRHLASGTSRADALVLRFAPSAGERVYLRVVAERAASYYLLTE
jgi:hypothetical protein